MNSTTVDPFFSPLVEKMRKELLRYLVSKTMFCPVSGRVLDVRTCVVFLDRDGDPSHVLSQEGWQRLAEVTKTKAGEDAVEVLASQGLFLDRSSVKESE